MTPVFDVEITDQRSDVFIKKSGTLQSLISGSVRNGYCDCDRILVTSDNYGERKEPQIYLEVVKK